jgi:hypothetical protein
MNKILATKKQVKIKVVALAEKFMAQICEKRDQQVSSEILSIHL